MDLLTQIIVFIFGACIGSFLGVVVDRLPSGEGISSGRSRCDYCKKPLSALDLIPILSFIFLGGKCRYCHRRLSYFYPLIEFVTGALFAFQFSISNSQFSIDLLFYLFIISCLIALFFIDLKYGLLPFSIVFPATFISVLYIILNTKYILLSHFMAGLGAFLFFLCLFLITRGKGMGFGDVVYAFFMGFILGFPKIILGLYIAFVSGAVVSLILIATKKKKLKGSTVPFGPFLVFGTIISMFWGERFVSLTTSLLGFTMK